MPGPRAAVARRCHNKLLYAGRWATGPNWQPDRLASLQIFFWNWVLCTFLLPKDVYDPPAIAIVKQLYAIDPSHERFGIVRIVTRFVRAPDLSDVSELFGAPGNFLFEKPMLSKIRFYAGDETVYIQHLRRETGVRARLSGRNQARTWIIQRSFSFPIALLACWARNHIVSGGDYCVDGGDIIGIGVRHI